MHINAHLLRACNLYGIDQFSFYVIETMEDPTRAELQAREQWYIDNSADGYNIAPANGGDTLSKHPDRDNIIKNRTIAHRKWLDGLSQKERKDKFAKMGEDNPNWKNGGQKICCPVCAERKIAPTSKTCGKCRHRTGENNPFYSKKHSTETLGKLIESGGKWIKGIDPASLPYTMHYEIIYPDGTTKTFAGLKAIASTFNVSIANVHATINRIKNGVLPTKGVFSGHIIKKMPKQ